MASNDNEWSFTIKDEPEICNLALLREVLSIG